MSFRMLFGAVIYLTFILAFSEQSSLGQKSCPCAEYTPIPCVCHAGATPYCICKKIIQSWTCTCAVEVQVIECYKTCRPLCVSTCHQDKVHPGCASFCNGICAQSCIPPQSILPIPSAPNVPVVTSTLFPPRNPIAPATTGIVPLPHSSLWLPTHVRNLPAFPLKNPGAPVVTKYRPAFPEYPGLPSVTGAPPIRRRGPINLAVNLPATAPPSILPIVSGMPPTVPPSYRVIPAAAGRASTVPPPVFSMAPAVAPIIVRDICPYSSYEMCQRLCAGSGSALCFPLCMKNSERVCAYHRLHSNSSNDVVSQPSPPQTPPTS